MTTLHLTRQRLHLSLLVDLAKRPIVSLLHLLVMLLDVFFLFSYLLLRFGRKVLLRGTFGVALIDPAVLIFIAERRTGFVGWDAMLEFLGE
jgi:hypothetical protein